MNKEANYTHTFDRVRVVMVNTTEPGNLGAAARAMKNMNLSQLTLVNPQGYPSAVATARASGADDVLSNALVCNSLLTCLCTTHSQTIVTVLINLSVCITHSQTIQVNTDSYNFSFKKGSNIDLSLFFVIFYRSFTITIHLLHNCCYFIDFGGLVYHLICKWWLQQSVLFFRTNSIHISDS
jgi:hypothetical protein